MNVRTVSSVPYAVRSSDHRGIVLTTTDHRQVAGYTTNFSLHRQAAHAFPHLNPQTSALPANHFHPHIFILIIPDTTLQAAHRTLQNI